RCPGQAKIRRALELPAIWFAVVSCRGSPVMSRAARPPFETLADVLQQLGGIDPSRVRADVLPGTATEHDLVRLLDRSQRLYELVDGVLVEKAMGTRESFLAGWLIY